MRLSRSRHFSFDEHRFVVGRGVFDPVRHLSGIAFAEQMAAIVEHHAPDARTALDLGTGCGLLAATLARLGLAVVATDINEAAVTCAAQNCHGLDVAVRHGDMFTPVAGERFDLVVINPPYERDAPSWRSDASLTSPDFLERVGATVHDFAPTAVLGFPAEDAALLDVTGLGLVAWRTVQTSGDDLGLFVSHATGRNVNKPVESRLDIV